MAIVTGNREPAVLGRSRRGVSREPHLLGRRGVGPQHVVHHPVVASTAERALHLPGRKGAGDGRNPSHTHGLRRRRKPADKNGHRSETAPGGQKWRWAVPARSAARPSGAQRSEPTRRGRRQGQGQGMDTRLTDELEGGAGLAELLGDAPVDAEHGALDRGRQRQRVEEAVDRFPHREPLRLPKGRHALGQEAAVLVVQLPGRGNARGVARQPPKIRVRACTCPQDVRDVVRAHIARSLASQRACYGAPPDCR
jgi:hypothetical protein